MALIETKNLTYTYPGATNPSISDVSIKVEKGEFVLITGPSGCGKTTLCRTFNGLIPQFYQGELKGEITVAGLDAAKHPTYEMAKHVGLVFQNPENQLFALSVEKDVAFGLENLGFSREEMRKRVDWALNLTGIYDLRERSPHEMSGGQQQRVAIASVLAMQPEIIVLDEPTSFLDPLSAEKIFEVIHELKQETRLNRYSCGAPTGFNGKVRRPHHNHGSRQGAFDGDTREILSNEETRLIGVGIPKATLLYEMLQKEGANLRQPNTTIIGGAGKDAAGGIQTLMLEVEDIHLHLHQRC